MDTIEVSTVVSLPPEDVYEFLLDFPGYADYTDYLQRVERVGAGDRGHGGTDEAGEPIPPGGPGTEYRLHFQWWKLSYVAHSKVTAVDPPHAIDWTITKDLDAHGRWLIEPVEGDELDGTHAAAPASRIRLVVHYDSDSAHAGILDLPRFVPMDRVIRQVTDLIVEEGKNVVRRAVADLEGRTRPVDLTVEYR